MVTAAKFFFFKEVKQATKLGHFREYSLIIFKVDGVKEILRHGILDSILISE